jgi:hypothetical protein
MPRTNLCSQSVSRIELDQRSREARLRFEQTNRLFVLSATVTRSWLRGLLYLCTVGTEMLGFATCPVYSTFSKHRSCQRDTCGQLTKAKSDHVDNNAGWLRFEHKATPH